MAASTGTIQSRAYSSTELGVWLFLGTVTMLFAAFTSALLVRRVSADWQPLSLPPMLWVNTAILLCSSGTFTLAQRSKSKGRIPLILCWLSVTLLLGLLFLAGQLVAWWQLAAQGVFLPTNPHSSFFYIMTGLHGIHLTGGVIALGVLDMRLWFFRNDVALQPVATYWHFMGLLWIVIFLILSFL